MNLNIKDNNGIELNIGDKVQVLKITDDSGNASDIYGVESHLNAWVDILYIESFVGEIVFDEVKLMVVIKNNKRTLPLSSEIRYDIWNDLYDRLKEDDLRVAKEDFNLKDTDYETIIDFIIKQ